MKKNAPWIAAAAMCVMLAVCLVQIFSLKAQIQSLERQMHAEMSRVNSNIDNIYYNVRSALEEQADLLAASEWEYGEVNIPDRTVQVQISITPKEFSPSVTQAALVCDGREFPMTYGEGTYTALLDVPFFGENIISQVLLNDGGTIRTQPMSWSISPRYEVLLWTDACFSGTCGGTLEEDGFFQYCCDGVLEVNVAGERSFQIQSMDLVEVLDGKEVGRFPIVPGEIDQNVYGEEVDQTWSVSMDASPEGATVAVDGGEHVYTSCRVCHTYSIPKGSAQELYVDIVDGYGLRYRILANQVRITEAGNMNHDQADEGLGEIVAIYDENGAVLYDYETDGPF